MANSNALPAYGGATVPYTYAEAWELMRKTLATVVSSVANAQTQIASGSVSAAVIINLSNNLATQNALLTTIGALGTPLATYAATQSAYLSGLGAANIVAGFQAIQTAISAVTTWVGANAPGNALTIDSTGLVVYANIPQASLAPLVTLLTTLTNTIT